MKEGWATKTSHTKGTTWHFYRNGKALCNQRNFFLEADKLKESPELSNDSNQLICKKCMEKRNSK